LEGLTISAPTHQQPIIEVARLDLRQHGGTWIAQSDRAVLHRDAQQLRRLLARCGAAHPGRDEQSVQISIERVVLAHGADDAALRDLVARRDAGGDLYVSVQQDESAEAPWRLELTTQADGAQRLRFDTGPTPLPAEIAAWVYPAAETLGDVATYLGTADFLVTESGLSGNAAGSLQGLNLGALSRQFLPAQMKVSGEAALTLADVRFEKGRLTQAKGSFQSRSGKIGRPWLEALVHELNVQWQTAVGGQPQPSMDETQYEQCAFDFLLEPHQFRIAGRCAGTPPGTMMTSGDGRVVLSTALSQPQPVTSLARLLSPPTRDWIPATAEANWVWQHLPIADQNTASRSRDSQK